MNIAALTNSLPLFVEIGADRLRARRGREGVEVPMERGPDGRLTAATRERVLAALRNLVNAKSWQPHPRAWCAIGSRGVSVRRLTLPEAGKDEFYQRLRLQVEAEFPLPPEELAWGWQPVGPGTKANGEPGRQEVMVAAVKKELVVEYQEILQACGTNPVFTLAAVARWSFCGQPGDAHGLLEVDHRQAELTIFEHGLPKSSRIIFWDGAGAHGSMDASIGLLGQKLQAGLTVPRLLVMGTGVSREWTDRLGQMLNNGCRCERVEVPAGQGDSAAISGLEQLSAEGRGPALTLGQSVDSSSAPHWSSGEWKKWGLRAGGLALAILLLPYAEAFLLKPHLEHQVAAFQAESERLKVIDRELDFLGNLKMSQPPYLDLVYLFSKSVPPGTQFDQLSMNNHGEISLRCAFQTGQQVTDFRNKLIASGFFTNVVVEEQTPAPDHRKLSIRMSAMERSATDVRAASARLQVEASKERKEEPAGAPAPGPGAPVMGRGPQ